MRQRSYSLLGFALLTVIYIAILFYIESQQHLLLTSGVSINSLPIVLVLVLASLSIRYCRWRRLLYRIGYEIRLLDGFFAYMSGFAYTMTPGKIGELIRVRYFQDQNVPHSAVISCFIYERSMDMVVVLMLASIALASFADMKFIIGFVLLVVFLLTIIIYLKMRWIKVCAYYFRRIGMKRLSRLIRLILKSLVQLRFWVNWNDMIFAGGLGMAAWFLVALSFVLLCWDLSIDIPFFTALGLYPVALLAGAASMIPGGLGSTEVVVVALLTHLGIAVGVATLAALIIRISTLWFVILLGFCCMWYLERNKRQELR